VPGVQTAGITRPMYPDRFPESDVKYTCCIAGRTSGAADRPGTYPRPLGGVTMSIHKLSAGSGYDYLTRQVAALDATHKGHVGLASYYTERGETPGVWVGSGLAGIDGLAVGDPVTAEQMRYLFGEGRHPLTAGLTAERHDVAAAEQVTRLGLPFKVYSADSPFRREVAARFAAANRAAGQPARAPLPAAERARIRTEVAREFFRRQHGRNPMNARELSGMLARLSRPATTAVAGYDLTFSPVKSVSSLWAVADSPIAAQVEEAHHAAVADALRFLEQHALFTRVGANGVRQVDVKGVVAAAFTHRDSRAGDPDLHTHVAVANKVQTLDGRWLSIDGRVLFAATVAASETYNTALECHLHQRLGVRFADRPGGDPRKRPVREIIGVDPRLNQCWSARRQLIEVRQAELAAQFLQDHGRPPMAVEAVQLAQQATLETRDAKHEPRTLAEQRSAWHAQAVDVPGSREAVQQMISAALHAAPTDQHLLHARWVAATAERVVAVLEEHRATWQVWHVRAEALRQIRGITVAAGRLDELVNLVVDEALHRSVALVAPDDGIAEPAELQRRDRTSVYTVAGSASYTSGRILAAEHRLLATAGRTNGWTVDPAIVELALLESTANGVALDEGQAELVRAMATSGSRLQLAVAAAGTGKTTAVRVLARAWTDDGGHVVGLAPSAAAAAQLRDQTGVPADTLAKLSWALTHEGTLPDWAAKIGPRSLVLIDEAGMADTVTLDTVVDFVTGRGGNVRLIGDDQQLAAVGAGGVLTDLQAQHGAVRLTEVHRFSDPTEAAATLAVRDGRPEALGFYVDRNRIHVADLTSITDSVLAAWQADRAAGLDALMLAPTRQLVAQLNQRARAHRLGGRTAAREVELADGNRASVGDLIITRRNQRQLRLGVHDWVKNGDRWTITAHTATGGLRVTHLRTGRTVTLPAQYVAESTELGYASTIHGAQGVTADSMHGLIGGNGTRRQLYTMLTRGRTANHLYLPVTDDGDPHTIIRPETLHPATTVELFEQILARDDTITSANTQQHEQHDPGMRLGHATARYVDALHAATEHSAGADLTAAIDRTAEQLAAGLTQEPAWPTVRAHLLLLAAAGADPLTTLTGAASKRELDTAADRAAVLDARVRDTDDLGTGPLPWLPGIPARLADNPKWGPYLAGRARLVTDLAAQVRTDAAARLPGWAADTDRSLPGALIGDIQIWRAANQVDAHDCRPTGPAQLQQAARDWQIRLHERLTTGDPSVDDWTRTITRLMPTASTDPFAEDLAERLTRLTQHGYDTRRLLRAAVDLAPLPDEHPSMAIWWRISTSCRKTQGPPPTTSTLSRSARTRCPAGKHRICCPTDSRRLRSPD
jgi:conjugative relaxase-like TrwC/TraI family protein